MASTSSATSTSLKSISFVEPTQESYHPAPKLPSAQEEEQHHNAQEEFSSRRPSNVCSLVLGAVFMAAACALFWVGADLDLKDLTILGVIFLIFGVVLFVVSLVILLRSYRRARQANSKVFDREFVPKKQAPRQGSATSAITKSDISIRGFSPVPEQRQPSTADLYSTDAIKPSDISQFQTALQEHKQTEKRSENSQSRTVIQLGERTTSPHDDVVIIHDARIALPNPQHSEPYESNNSNQSNAFNSEESSGPVIFTLDTQEHTVHLPGTPDLSTEEASSVPHAFDYVDPHSASTDL